MANARRAGVNIKINSRDITTDITPYLTGFSFSSVLDGESDTAEIELQDRERLWIQSWFPNRGDTCEVEIFRTNFTGDEQTEVLPVGVFEIDEISNSFPPNRAKIKLNSISNNSELRSIDKSRSWEKVNLSKICRDIADDAKLELFYDTGEDPEISRAEQKTQSNLSFLYKLCKDHGIAIRVSDGKLIVFDEEKLESQPPVTTLEYGSFHVKQFSGTATISKIYSSAHVTYSHGKQKEKIEHTYTDTRRQSGMTLEINKKVSSQAEAERLAKKELRDKNKKEITVRLDVLGDFCYLAGNVIELGEGFGFYSGNYIIEKSDFKIGSGFTCSLDLRKCLSGY